MTQMGDETITETDEWRSVGPCHENGPVVEPRSEQQAKLWALVLDARSVPCGILREEHGWRLLVPPEEFDRARQELTLFETENRNWPPPEPPELPLVANTLSTLSILLLVATFHNVTNLDIPLTDQWNLNWQALGSARADLIRNGQWWRTATSLTLHANWPHLLANLTIGGVFIVSLCRELGSGLAWSLILGAGMLGNAINADVQLPNHNSVGASTAVFGAVGILSTTLLVRRRLRRTRRWALPVAGAVALLATLGTEGTQTDLGAHLFGFLAGIVLGILAGYLVNRWGRPGPLMNAALALLAGGMILLAWGAALLSG